MEVIASEVASTSASIVSGVPQIVGYGLAVGGLVLTATIGWKLFKRFAR